MKLPWLTCHFLDQRGGWVCASVAVRSDGVIVEAAPKLFKFIGQRWENLAKWVNGIGGGVEWLP